ncbi:MAG: hypothetical protein AB8G05_16565 [Oligoflexales bacterium]
MIYLRQLFLSICFLISSPGLCMRADWPLLFVLSLPGTLGFAPHQKLAPIVALKGSEPCRSVISCQIPIAETKGISKSLPSDLLYISPSFGATHLESINKVYFDKDENTDANFRLYHSLFHSIDGSQVVATQLGRNPAFHFHPQSIAEIMAMGVQAVELDSEDFLKQKERLKEELFDLIITENTTNELGLSFTDSVNNSQKEFEDLKRKLKILEKKKKFFQRQLRAVEGDNDSDEIEDQMIDVKNKIDQVKRRIHKEKPQLDSMNEKLKDFITLFFEAIEETQEPKLYYSKNRPFNALLSYLWLRVSDKGELIQYLNKLENLGILDKGKLPENLESLSFDLEDLRQIDLSQAPNLSLKDDFDKLTFCYQQNSQCGAMPILRYGSAYVDLDEKNYRFSDCVETSIRNFINSFIWDRSRSNLDIEILHKLNEFIEIHPGLIKFYEEFNSIDQHESELARNKFAGLLSGSDKDFNTDEGEGIIYKRDDVFEIKSSAENVERVIELLFGTSFDQLIVSLKQIGIPAEITQDNSETRFINLDGESYSWSVRTGHSVFDNRNAYQKYSQNRLELGKNLIKEFAENGSKDDWYILNHFLQLNSHPELFRYVDKILDSKGNLSAYEDLLLHSAIDEDQKFPLKLKFLLEIESKRPGKYREQIPVLIDNLLTWQGANFDRAFDIAYSYKDTIPDALKKFYEHRYCTAYAILKLLKNQEYGFLGEGQINSDNFPQYLSNYLEKNYWSNQRDILDGLIEQSEEKYIPFFHLYLTKISESKGKQIYEKMAQHDPIFYKDFIAKQVDDQNIHRALIKRKKIHLFNDIFEKVSNMKPSKKITYQDFLWDYIMDVIDYDNKQMLPFFENLIPFMSASLKSQILNREGTNIFKQELERKFSNLFVKRSLSSLEEQDFREYLTALAWQDESKRFKYFPSWQELVRSEHSSQFHQEFIECVLDARSPLN